MTQNQQPSVPLPEHDHATSHVKRQKQDGRGRLYNYEPETAASVGLGPPAGYWDASIIIACAKPCPRCQRDQGIAEGRAALLQQLRSRLKTWSNSAAYAIITEDDIDEFAIEREGSTT